MNYKKYLYTNYYNQKYDLFISKYYSCNKLLKTKNYKLYKKFINIIDINNYGSKLVFILPFSLIGCPTIYYCKNNNNYKYKIEEFNNIIKYFS